MFITNLGNITARYGKIINSLRSLEITKRCSNPSSDFCGLALKQLNYDSLNITSKFKSKGTILPIEHAKNKPNLIDAYDIPGEGYKYFNGQKLFDIENMRFADEINPLMLEKKAIPAEEKVNFISNFEDIGGTIAATTDLDKCIATDRMYQCAGLSVVDRSLNKQSLIHVYPGFSVESNKEIISKILSGSNPKNLEISIVPGCEYYTEDTVAFLADITNKLAPEAKINFCNFPNYSHYHPNELPAGHTIEQCVEHIGGEAAIWLKNGKLFCCDKDSIHNKVVNPKEFLIYFG